MTFTDFRRTVKAQLYFLLDQCAADNLPDHCNIHFWRCWANGLMPIDCARLIAADYAEPPVLTEKVS